MEKAQKELFEQVRLQKKKEYENIYNSLYKKIFSGIMFVILFVINIFGLEDEIMAYVVGLILIVIFDFIWRLKRKNDTKS